ncbi:MAG: SPW repeat protein [Candidatus Jorgensenbacteria bacterium]
MGKWYCWVLVGLGVWVLISPWVLGFSALNLARWNNALMGLVIIILAFWWMVPPRESV